MQLQVFLRFNILLGLTLSIFGAACQESKGRKFEQSSAITTYSKSEIINEEMESFLSTDQFAKAVDALGELTPMKFFEQILTDIPLGMIVIENETLEISEDDIAALRERYTNLNLAYGSMAQMWEESDFNPYVLDSDDFKEAISVTLDAISGVYNETFEEIPDSFPLLGPVGEVKAGVKMCQIALRCKDNPGQTVKEAVNPDNWKLIAEHQKTASVLVGAAYHVAKFQGNPHAGLARNAGNALIACAPTVVGIANAFGAYNLVQDAGAQDCQQNY